LVIKKRYLGAWFKFAFRCFGKSSRPAFPSHIQDKMNSMRKISAVILLLGLVVFLFVSPMPVWGQSGLNLRVSDPELAQFPKVALYLDVFDKLGIFVSDLTLRNVKLTEDGHERIVNETILTQPGLDTIIALNLSPTLSNRSVAGATRLQEIYSTLLNWINSLPPSSATDLYSLTSNEGILKERQKERSQFVISLQNYQPNLFNLKSNLDSLKFALDLAAKTNPIPNGKQAIFYLTALPVEGELPRIEVLANRAVQLKVPVFVWLLAADASANSPAASVLTELAQKTGGKFFLYNETIKAPNPEEYFISLRNTYRLRYTSAINQSGTHKISVQVQRGDQTTNSPEISFNIDLKAPIPSLINSPLQITRAWTKDEQGNLTLKPDLLTLQIKVDFPDGYPRQLKSSRLIVDGKIVIQNTQQPLDYFGWPLEEYRYNAMPALQVEVEDILGFTGKSIELIIPVNVTPRSSSPLGQVLDFLGMGGWLIPVGLLLVGSVTLVYRQRGRIREIIESRRIKKEMEHSDPLTQQVLIPNESGSLNQTSISPGPGELAKANTQESPRLTWAGKKPAPPGLEMILLDQPEMFVGRNKKQCQIVLNLPSVENIHALIITSTEGQVKIANRSVKNGTWVNFAPVSSLGANLWSGDLVHFGKAAFRFEISQPNRITRDPQNY
jgi:hypothetical protein